jgi:hypothetical protein
MTQRAYHHRWLSARPTAGHDMDYAYLLLQMLSVGTSSLSTANDFGLPSAGCGTDLLVLSRPPAGANAALTSWLEKAVAVRVARRPAARPSRPSTAFPSQMVGASITDA